MAHASRLPRGTLPCLAAVIIVTGFALPASAAQPGPASPATLVAGTTRAAEWWLTTLNVAKAWRAAPAGGKGVVVAVLSTGVDAKHQDLARTVATGQDFCDSGRTAAGPFWGYEGTAVASLLAGHGHGAGGTQGITGVAPGARILAVQVTLEYNDPLNADAAITRRLPDAVAAGIRYAVTHGATVIALPLDPGTLGPAVSGATAAAGGSTAERAAVSYALAHDVVLIAPAGDNGASSGTINYPAAYPGVVAVGATDRGGKLAPFTSARSYVALTAPGSGLTVADPDGAYSTLASTDMSAALAAGVAALIRSRFPRLTATEVTRALVAGAHAAGARQAPGSGHGALDAAAALTAAATLTVARQPAPARSSSPATRAPAPAPAPRPSTRHVAAPAPGLSAVAGSVIRDAVIAAGALIVALACVLALIAARRRRAEFARRAQGAQRSGQGGSHAKRSRTAAGQPRQTPVRPAALASRQPRALNAVPPKIVPAPVPGALGTAGRARRRKAATGKPPWEPASMPEKALPAAPQLPALPVLGGQVVSRGQHAALPPWERAPAEFAAAPVPPDLPEWSPSNTGPMYVWNPNSATSPQPVLEDQDSERSVAPD